MLYVKVKVQVTWQPRMYIYFICINIILLLKCYKDKNGNPLISYFRTRNSNDFDVSVNVAAGEKVTFNLWYQEVLQRRVGHYEHIINIDPGQIVPDLKVEVYINESRPLTVVHVPPIRKEGAKDKEKESEYQFLWQFNYENVLWFEQILRLFLPSQKK